MCPSRTFVDCEKICLLGNDCQSETRIHNRHELVRGEWTTELEPTYTAETIWFHSCLQSSSCVNIQYIPITL